MICYQTHNGRIQWLESNWKEVFIFPIYRAHNNSSNGTNFLIKTRWCFGSAFCISIWHGTLHSAAHRVIIHDFLRGKPFSRLRNFTYKHRFLSSLKWCSRAYIQRWSFWDYAWRSQVLVFLLRGRKKIDWVCSIALIEYCCKKTKNWIECCPPAGFPSWW